MDRSNNKLDIARLGGLEAIHLSDSDTTTSYL